MAWTAKVTVWLAMLFACNLASASDLDALVKSARAGDVNAMHNVGAAFANGNGTPQDFAEARKWFEKAAMLGQHNSMYSLAVMHRLGQGVDVDLVNAYAWYSLAAEYIPKDADEWFIPRAKVAMYMRRPLEIANQLSEADLRRATKLRDGLRVQIRKTALEEAKE